MRVRNLELKNSYKKKSNVAVLGFLILLGTNMASPAISSDTSLFVILGFLLAWVVGLVCWFYGLAYYAMSKGYSGTLALLGIIGCFGLLILAILKDRWQNEGEQMVVDSPSNYPRNMPPK